MAPKASTKGTKRDSMSMPLMLMAFKTMEKNFRKSTSELTDARSRLKDAEQTLKSNDETLSGRLHAIAELERTVSTQALELTRARLACMEVVKQRDAARNELELQAAQHHEPCHECNRLRRDLSLTRSRLSTLDSENAELRSQVREASSDRCRLASEYSTARRKSQDLRSHFSSKLLEIQSLLIQEQDAPSEAVRNSAIYQQARLLKSLTEEASNRSSDSQGPRIFSPQSSAMTRDNSRTSHKRLRVTANSNDSSSSSSTTTPCLFTPVLSRSTPSDMPITIPISKSPPKQRTSVRVDQRQDDAARNRFAPNFMFPGAHIGASFMEGSQRERPGSASSSRDGQLQQGKQQHEDAKVARKHSWLRSKLAFGGVLMSVGLGALAFFVMQKHSTRENKSPQHRQPTRTAAR